ncbi:heavy metal translocating P-type ATPase [Clostridium sp. OM05-6BH]|uniref:heavy metal translocating P-type ATPase n=1 Tax=unclassified Clostridium TaxID=2614128 RepID=UPI000E492AB4|nr:MULTISPECIES: heavy metal translocating P-type ATPase [unclassified Clostridium]RHV17489.1 heavy metal translocating P-type ATPase [Clostridium sp. OM05-9BH]RHV21635.1 heavy metal translocating P-type ATPase [Clostridium sp. OM05-6BH]
MKFVIKHEIRGRIRVHLIGKAMSFAQADTLQYQFEQMKDVTAVKVQERTMDVTICYIGSRKHIITALGQFSYDKVEVPEVYLKNSGREMNRFYWDKLVDQTVVHFVNKIFLPAPLRAGIATVRSVKYIVQGVKTLAKRKIEVPVLDATAISVSLIRGDYKTAGAVMFLLSMGEILEEWTHKKSVGDLARSLSLNIDKVWLVTDDTEVQVSAAQIKEGDWIRVHMGAVIPFDGIVMEGEALVNQASLTGESLPVRKAAESPVYAGTVVEEGEITLLVKEGTGSSKYEKIMTMIEDSEKLKSSLEGKAEHLADRLVPYTFLGTGLTLALTRNTVKALSVLMVDFSCALKLAMPLSVLSAIRESSAHDITVKGGKFLEAVAEADTIVFDKTGTLTKAQPTVVEVIPFDDRSPDELLCIAACLEEHFPHSMATAVVVEAMKRGLVHEELHTKVEYIVAHGISSTINDKKIIIGSHHFVFEDEGAVVPEDKKEQFEQLPEQYSHLYMAMDGKLVAVICIEDPLRVETAEVIRELKHLGIHKVVMMTGDSDRIAANIAQKAGVDAYYSEVLPEDKANFVEQEKKAGHKVIMVGDGINDSPALSAADVGIAISEGAEIAREIADVTIAADDLREIITLKKISNALMKRIDRNYKVIVGFNTALILFGVGGVLQPTMSALLHNTSTILISLKSMENLLEE